MPGLQAAIIFLEAASAFLIRFEYNFSKSRPKFPLPIKNMGRHGEFFFFFSKQRRGVLLQHEMRNDQQL